MIKFSIVTTCMNSAKSITETIESVNMQLNTDIEHIFIDGGSTDDTLYLIKKIAKRNPILLSEKDKGIYDAMNKGIEIASGDYILFLNSDDQLDRNDILHIVSNKLTSNPDIFFASTKMIKSKNGNEFVWNPSYPNKYPYFFQQNPHPSTFVKISFLKKCKYLFPIKYKICSDLHQQLILIYKYKAKVFTSNLIVTNMAIGGASTINKMIIIKNTIEAYKVFRDNFNRTALLFITQRLFKKLNRLKL